MGEAWHNNHHAFPGSAQIGLYPGQSDWGYAFILLLERVGLASNIALPEHLARGKALTRVAPEDRHAASNPSPWPSWRLRAGARCLVTGRPSKLTAWRTPVVCVFPAWAVRF